MRNIFLFLSVVSFLQIEAQYNNGLNSHPLSSTMNRLQVNGIEVKRNRKPFMTAYIAYGRPDYEDFRLCLAGISVQDTIRNRYRSSNPLNDMTQFAEWDSVKRIFHVDIPPHMNAESFTWTFDSSGRIASTYREFTSEAGSQINTYSAFQYLYDKHQIIITDSVISWGMPVPAAASIRKLCFDNKNENLLAEEYSAKNGSWYYRYEYEYINGILKSMKEITEIKGRKTVSNLYTYRFAENLNEFETKRKKKSA